MAGKDRLRPNTTTGKWSENGFEPKSDRVFGQERKEPRMSSGWVYKHALPLVEDSAEGER
jgi:hypothetical protein